jgi:fructoselysine-6-P-deglycase FrlB-like protein
MSFATTEIASQPEMWTRAAAMATDASVQAALPADGERVAIVGCGTSYNVAQACAALRERTGRGETDAFPASEFPHGRKYDRVVAVCRSGTTTEMIELVGAVAANTRTTVLSTAADLPVPRLAQDAIALGFADEQSVVQTRFATSVVALWRAYLGEDLTQAVADAAAELATATPSAFAEQYTFLGTGWTIGLAHEAALKLREAAQLWTESYAAMEYRHGPISITDQRSSVWVFGAVPEGLAAQIIATGAKLETAPADPLALLVRAQRIAVAIAEAKGLNPDTPRALSRAVILDEA